MDHRHEEAVSHDHNEPCRTCGRVTAYAWCCTECFYEDPENDQDGS